MKIQSWQVSRDISTFGIIFLVINLGIGGDCVENVLWRARDIPFLPLLKNVVILCGTNIINKDSPYDIAQGFIVIGSAFKNQPSNSNIFICGILLLRLILLN